MTFISVNLISLVGVPSITVFKLRTAGVYISATFTSQKSISEVVPLSSLKFKSLIISFFVELYKQNEVPTSSVTPEILPHKVTSKIPVVLITISVPFCIEKNLLIPDIILVAPILLLLETSPE